MFSFSGQYFSMLLQNFLPILITSLQVVLPEFIRYFVLNMA